MSITNIAPLPAPEELDAAFPEHPDHRVEERRNEVRAILNGSDHRKIFVVGPCSAWPFDAVHEYADRLTALQEKVKEHVLLVMRTYIQKPRTTVGWTGPLNEPNPCESPDIPAGIWKCREMMHTIAQQIGIADEALFTHNADYFGKLLTWVALGARSGEDSEHRFLVAGLDAPVGIKHPTSGNIQAGVNSVLSAQYKDHQFAYRDHQVLSSGNPYAHLILRGGGGRSNYDPQQIAFASKALQEANVSNPSIFVDASHENSLNGKGKDPTLQSHVIRTVLLGVEEQLSEYDKVKGFMAESFIKEGAQPIKKKLEEMDLGGCSITDPCLGWDKTERLIHIMADTLDRIHGSPARKAV